MPDSHATSCSVSLTNCPFVPCPTILLPDVLWQQWGDAKSFSVLPIALFHTSFLSFSDGSSVRGIFCTSSSCLQTCNVPVCRWHTAGVRRSQGTDLRYPLSSCSTVVSSALQPVALPLFFSSPSHIFFPPVHKKPRHSQTLPCTCVAAKPCQRQCFLSSAKLQNIIGKLHNQSTDNQPPSLFNLV